MSVRMAAYIFLYSPYKVQMQFNSALMSVCFLACRLYRHIFLHSTYEIQSLFKGFYWESFSAVMPVCPHGHLHVLPFQVYGRNAIQFLIYMCLFVPLTVYIFLCFTFLCVWILSQCVLVFNPYDWNVIVGRLILCINPL